jgi:hypothetical protein
MKLTTAETKLYAALTAKMAAPEPKPKPVKKAAAKTKSATSKPKSAK